MSSNSTPSTNTSSSTPNPLPLSRIVPWVAGAMVPIFWWWVYHHNVTSPLSDYYGQHLLAFAALGGLGVVWWIKQRWAERGNPPTVVTSITLICAILLPLILWGAGSSAFQAEKKKEEAKAKGIVEPEALPFFGALVAPKPLVEPWKESEADELQQKYWLSNAELHGWKSSLPETDTATKTFPVVRGSEGIVTEADVNVALMKGSRLRVVAPEMDAIYQTVSVQLGEEGQWRAVGSEEEVYIEKDLGAVRVKATTRGAATSLPISFTPIAATSENHVLIQTRGFGKGGHRIMWGLLPPADKYDFKVYIRYTKEDGGALPKSYLAKTPGSYLVFNETTAKKVADSLVTKNERIFSSRETATSGQEALAIVFPGEDTERFRADVKLLILPKGSLGVR